MATGDDYSIWKLRLLGVMTSKNFFGMDLAFDEWYKKNKAKLKMNKHEVVEKYNDD
jgi:hypothetical protein